MNTKSRTRIRDYAPIIAAVIGAFALIISSLMPFLFGQGPLQPTTPSASTQQVNITDQPDTPIFNSQSNQRPIDIGIENFMRTIMGGVGLMLILMSVMSLWITRPGLTILQRLFRVDPVNRAYKLARFEALDGNLRKGIEWIKFAAKHDPSITDRVENDVAFEKLRDDTRYKVWLQDSTEKATNFNLSVFPIPGNSLGKSVKIGGAFKDEELKISASPWADFEGLGFVRSGWLYYSSNPSDVITFFKVHVRHNGNGYVHLLDAANPPHNIWFQIGNSPKKEQQFAWSDIPDARTVLWKFKWK